MSGNIITNSWGKTYLLKDRKILWDGRESRIEFVFDVSKYRNKLDKQEKQQAAMLRSLPGGIARLDARDERTILWYGSEFLSIIGYTEEQFKEELQSQCPVCSSGGYGRSLRRRCMRRRKRGGAASCRAGS